MNKNVYYILQYTPEQCRVANIPISNGSSRQLSWLDTGVSKGLAL